MSEEVDRLYEQVCADNTFQFGYRLSPGVKELNEAGKLMIIALYERATGKTLLPPAPVQEQRGEQDAV